MGRGGIIAILPPICRRIKAGAEKSSRKKTGGKSGPPAHCSNSLTELYSYFLAAFLKRKKQNAAKIRPTGYATMVLFLKNPIRPRHSGAIIK